MEKIGECVLYQCRLFMLYQKEQVLSYLPINFSQTIFFQYLAKYCKNHLTPVVVPLFVEISFDLASFVCTVPEMAYIAVLGNKVHGPYFHSVFTKTI